MRMLIICLYHFLQAPPRLANLPLALAGTAVAAGVCSIIGFYFFSWVWGVVVPEDGGFWFNFSIGLLFLGLFNGMISLLGLFGFLLSLPKIKIGI